MRIDRLLGPVLFTVMALAAAAGLTGDNVVETPLSQREIEAQAVSHARAGAQYLRLVGAPTSIVSKRITFTEFNERLDPFSNDPMSPDTLVWLVVVHGNVVVSGPVDSTGSVAKFDNLWALLDTKGNELGWGTQKPGHEIDFNTPPVRITSWPTVSPAEYTTKPIDLVTQPVVSSPISR
jgi:hypothetical protein